MKNSDKYLCFVCLCVSGCAGCQSANDLKYAMVEFIYTIRWLERANDAADREQKINQRVSIRNGSQVIFIFLVRDIGRCCRIEGRWQKDEFTIHIHVRNDNILYEIFWRCLNTGPPCTRGMRMSSNNGNSICVWLMCLRCPINLKNSLSTISTLSILFMRAKDTGMLLLRINFSM